MSATSESAKVLVFGSQGQVGWELVRRGPSLGRVIPLTREDIDLAGSTPSELRSYIRSMDPDVVINAAAYTDVDGAEYEQEKAWLVNAVAPAIMADECRSLGSTFVHYSTDYVFDGEGRAPYQEGDAPAPLNHYGRTKLEGETAVQNTGERWLILRTSWVYSFRKRSFPVRVLQWSRNQSSVRIVEDQVASPTWASMLADVTVKLVAMALSNGRDWMLERSGIYHVAGRGEASRFTWAERILQLDPRRDEQVCERLIPAKRSDFNEAAERPAYTALDCTRLERIFDIELPTWDQALQAAMSGEKIRERV